MKLDIVYQADDFIIIYKPCGLSVHKDQSEIGLTTLLAEQLDMPQVWLVHRLDKVTSGLLILALNAESAAEFFRLFSAHYVQKTYLALSNQKPKKKQGLIIGDMQKKGCDAVILGCTELSIIDKDFNLSKKDSKIIDSMEVLARRSIELCGKKIKE